MKIFISYAHVDRPFVDNLAERLSQFHDVWFDKRLLAGTDWWETILKRLGWCDCFLYVLTPESLASEYCQKEFAEAQQLNKAIMPVQMQSNIELPKALASIQYADFSERTFEDALADLIGSLGALEVRVLKSAKQTPALVLSSGPADTGFDTQATYRAAVEARNAGDHETALRLLNTLKQVVPDLFPEQVKKLIADSEAALSDQARHKEYQRIYQEISLLVLDDLTLDAARALWQELRKRYADIDYDPLALKLNLVQRHPYEPETVLIPAGPFLMGSPASDSLRFENEPEQFELDLNYDYAISKYPVTVEQYRAFIDDDGYQNQHYWTDTGWQQRVTNRWMQPHLWDVEKWTSPDDLPDLPVVGISWYEAYAYTQWLSKTTERNYRLLTESEWEKAARGGLDIPDGRGGFKSNELPARMWPWGDHEPTSELCNFEGNVGQTTPVNSHPAQASAQPYGLYHLSGNVWEWCLSAWSEDFVYPELTDPGGNSPRIVRGGSWSKWDEQRSIRCSCRRKSDPGSRGDLSGFRVAEIP